MSRNLLIVPLFVAVLALGAACTIFPISLPVPPQPAPTACSGSARVCTASPTPCKAAACVASPTPCNTDRCLPGCKPITPLVGAVSPSYVCYPPPLGTPTPCPPGRACTYSGAAVKP